MATRSLSFSPGALQACKTRIPPSTLARRPFGTDYNTLPPPRNTITSYRRYTTPNKSRHQHPPGELHVPENKTSEPATPKQQEQRQSVLDRMGATRNVKIAVIVFLCIYGTMETIFYAGALYRYFTKEKPTGESSTD